MSTVGLTSAVPAFSGTAAGATDRPSAGHPATTGAGASVPTSPASVRAAGPWLPATLLPGGTAGTGLPVELRLATSPISASALLGRVVASASGLALDLGGHLLTLAPQLVDLPEGARPPIELRAPTTGAIVTDRAGLERLVTQLRPNAEPAPPIPAGAGLAARLLAEWRRSGGAGRLDPPEDATARPAAAADGTGGWRSLFDLAGAGSAPLAPVMLWQHRPKPEALSGEAGVEHLRLVVELSRLGRVSIDLCVDARKLATTVTGIMPLDMDLRAAIGSVYAAAVELAGRSGSLAFRVVSSAAAVASLPGPSDDLII